MTKVLVATEKPFAEAAVNQIKSTFEKAGYDCRFFEKYESQDDLKKAVADADALIIRSDKITEEIMDAAPELKIVVRAGAGFDNVDLAAATAHNIVVMNTPGQNSNAVAELVLGMMVFQARNHFNGKPGTELKGKKLGIHAYGHVGKNVARIAKGFGMEVFAFDPFVDKADIEADSVSVFDNVEEMYSVCDYVSLHIPANKHTIKSINYTLLSKMKEGATLINTARKEVIDEEGLLKMFNKRNDFRYIADIAPGNREDIEKEFGDRCFFTPKKMGAQTAEANVNAGIAASNQIIAFLEKGDTTFKVN
ncbi:MAG TPA: 3-phosphoglycerate dehydrogenase [Bacteroidetes bacterium]|nr:3-phosphoglycerate dehydrogenase [Bacteroidota bacterium]